MVVIDKTKAARYIKLVNELKALESELKTDLKQQMEQNNETCIKSNGIKVTLTRAYIRHSFDTTTFKTEHPRVYTKYIKETQVASSIKLEV